MVSQLTVLKFVFTDDQTRVKIKHLSGDYINANHVNVSVVLMLLTFVLHQRAPDSFYTVCVCVCVCAHPFSFIIITYMKALGQMQDLCTCMFQHICSSSKTLCPCQCIYIYLLYISHTNTHLPFKHSSGNSKRL